MGWWNRLKARWGGGAEKEQRSPMDRPAPGDQRPCERCEKEARALLAEGRVDEALEFAQRQAPPTSSSRMLLNVCRSLAGRRVEAHLDLLEWSRRSCCPMDARLLLALLQQDESDRAGAILSLNRNLAQIDDPRTIQALILMHLERGDEAAARRWAQRLRGHAVNWTDRPMVSAWLGAVGLDVAESAVEPPDALVEQLALELLACESAIPSLEAAARYDRSRPRAMLLLAALESAFERLESPIAACEAMARLALTLDDPARARRWIDTGLDINPLCAPLAILLSQLPSAEEASNEAPRRRPDVHVLPRRREQIEALDLVIRAHPDWTDLRLARRRLEAA